LQQQNKTVIVIAGPTAVGKTSAAIGVASYFGTEIISADSRQCFKELNIGVARPSENELATVPHYFIASHSIQQKVTAVTFEEYALAKAAALFQKNNVVIMVGGTGLYIKAFCDGLDEIPEVPLELHNEIVSVYNEKGLLWLQEEVKKLDMEFWKNGEVHNPQRLMRAMEVMRATGKSILSFRRGLKKRRDFNIIKVALELPKETLHNNINHRVDKMVEEGLPEEVRSLLPYQHLNALQTVGYKELFQWHNKEASLAEAVEAIKQNTRRYAKRQLTWFRKDKGYTWSYPAAEQIVQAVKAKAVEF
jgi:tRNA dimethylallyltransferase